MFIYVGLLAWVFFYMAYREKKGFVPLKVAGNGEDGVAHAYFGHAVWAEQAIERRLKRNDNIKSKS